MSSTTVLNGCLSGIINKKVFVYPRQPVYEIPINVPLKNISAEEMRKISPEVREDIVFNFQALTSHVLSLEAIVKTHNEFAKTMNQTSGIYKER